MKFTEILQKDNIKKMIEEFFIEMSKCCMEQYEQIKILMQVLYIDNKYITKIIIVVCSAVEETHPKLIGIKKLCYA